eukprot:COSAG05_NODE_1699_length_4254_cov_3.541276_5_plen_305_part_00
MAHHRGGANSFASSNARIMSVCQPQQQQQRQQQQRQQQQRQQPQGATQQQLPAAVAACLPHNPNLDEEQAHRALLSSPPNTLAGWDALVSAMSGAKGSTVGKLAAEHGVVLLRPTQLPGCDAAVCGATSCTGACSFVPLSMTNLQLYTTDTCGHTGRLALCAGLFPFGSEFALPAAPLSARSFINYELAGEGGGRTHGRIVLDLGGGGVLKGRKAIKSVVDAGEITAETLACWCADASAACATTERDVDISCLPQPPTRGPAPTVARAQPLRAVLTIDRAFEAVYEGIICAKGLDWLGFQVYQL